MRQNRSTHGRSSTSQAQAERLAERLDGLVRRFKIGSQLFTAGGPAVVEAIQKRGAEVFLDLNFRRLQDLVYRPQCDGCRECRQLRVDVRRFHPSRSQRRCLKRNADVTAAAGPPAPSEEKHALYRRYLAARHDGQMSGSYREYLEFLHAAPAFTEQVVFSASGRTLGVGTYDATPDALSAVYFYFDPELESRSPGTFNVLWLIEEARRRALRFVYLGYYVKGSRQMAYKGGFHPHELLDGDGAWRVGARSGGRMAP